jgi:hypothetical protein
MRCWNVGRNGTLVVLQAQAKSASTAATGSSSSSD